MRSSEGYEGPLLVTAHLASPLAGDPPQLDALLEWSLSPFEPGFRSRVEQGIPHGRIDRAFPAPEQGKIRIPILRQWLGSWLVARCSNPILPVPSCETVEHIGKRIATEHAGMLADSERRIISTRNSWTKSYRLPLRVRLVDRVCWFAVGGKKSIRKALRDVRAIGKKVADGYGRVKSWEFAAVADDVTWFARHGESQVLMRTLPLAEMPPDVLGARRYFGACCPPYWHPQRFTEVATPC